MSDRVMAEELRKLPSVDRLLQLDDVESLVAESGREQVVEAVRSVLDRERARIVAGASCAALEALAREAAEVLHAWLSPSLRPVINATGVVIHTNLGRAPLSDAAREAMVAVAAGYSNLEYDLAAGQRGSRYVHAEALLKQLTGAEAALVVNNNAGAVLLILSALAREREVVISRGQLVEIGGGFRIPDVMRQSGAQLVEVGTTNRTHPADYETAITVETAALMRVHHSNFKMVGFTLDVALSEMVEIGRRHGVHVFDDLGSGTLLDTASVGLAHEPTVQESVKSGADLISFSGDKLLGGPQVGIIIGRMALVGQIRRHPLTRALRVDKVALAGLQATLLHYLEGKALTEVPVWRMMNLAPAALSARAERWRTALTAAQPGVSAEVIPGQSAIGGGSLPGEVLPTALLALAASSPESLSRRLRNPRHGMLPVVGRIENDRFLLDARTVLPGEDDALLRALLAALSVG
jgi:L-seryl-tRNA(Ser) seleniumtransferase